MLEVWLAGLQINRSASETSQRQRELALAPAAAGTLEHFHFSSWLLMMESKSFNLDINSVRTGTACFGFFYTDKQTDRDRWIHAYMIDAILCNICHFSTDPWLQFVNNTQVECHIFFQHSHKCPIYRIRTRQTERWLLNYSVTERQLPWQLWAPWQQVLLPLSLPSSNAHLSSITRSHMPVCVHLCVFSYESQCTLVCARQYQFASVQLCARVCLGMCTHAYDLPVVAILPVCGNGEYVCSERNTEVLEM